MVSAELSASLPPTDKFLTQMAMPSEYTSLKTGELPWSPDAFSFLARKPLSFTLQEHCRRDQASLYEDTWNSTKCVPLLSPLAQWAAEDVCPSLIWFLREYSRLVTRTEYPSVIAIPPGKRSTRHSIRPLAPTIFNERRRL